MSSGILISDKNVYGVVNPPPEDPDALPHQGIDSAAVNWETFTDLSYNTDYRLDELEEKNEAAKLVSIDLLEIGGDVVGKKVAGKDYVLTNIKLTNDDGEEDDHLGKSAAIYGNICAVGAPNASFNGTNSGVVKIYSTSNDGLTWGLVTTIYPDDEDSGMYFGYDVDIYDEYLVVGAYGDDTLDSNAGAIYVFKTNNTGWSTWYQVSKLTGDDSEAGDQYGHSVSIYGNKIIVGARYNDEIGSNAGAVYTYIRSGDDITFKEKITVSGGNSGDYFGFSLSVREDMLIVGAYGVDDNGSTSGAVYIYRTTNDGNNWYFKQKLVASDGEAGMRYGSSVDINNKYAVVGSYLNESKGSIYVYKTEDNGESWGSEIKLRPTDIETNDQFGRAVTMYSNKILASAGGHDLISENAGAVYLYETLDTGSSWTQKNKIVAQDVKEDQYFSFGPPFTVSIGEKYAVIGAYREGEDTAPSSGAAYILNVTVSESFYHMDLSFNMGIPNTNTLLKDDFNFRYYEEEQEIVDISFVDQKIRLELNKDYTNSKLIEIEYNRNEENGLYHLVDVCGNRVDDFRFGGPKHKRNNKIVMMPPLNTTEEISNIKAVEGMIVFNTTTKKHQGFDGIFWNDLY